MLLVASRGCWWQAEVVGGKRRLLVASRGCWWQAAVVGGKQRLLVASSGCWWEAEVVESSFEEENNEVSALNHPILRALTDNLLPHLLVALTKGFDAAVFAESQTNDKALGIKRWPYLR